MKTSDIITSKIKLAEDASAGASSAGAVASVVAPLGAGSVAKTSVYGSQKKSKKPYGNSITTSKKKVAEASRSEHDANMYLSQQTQGADVPHSIYAIKNGQPVGIAGPFKNKAAAEKHPARKLGAGVMPTHLIKRPF